MIDFEDVRPGDRVRYHAYNGLTIVRKGGKAAAEPEYRPRTAKCYLVGSAGPVVAHGRGANPVVVTRDRFISATRKGSK
jgi:hypothetical protein